MSQVSSCDEAADSMELAEDEALCLRSPPLLSRLDQRRRRRRWHSDGGVRATDKLVEELDDDEFTCWRGRLTMATSDSDELDKVKRWRCEVAAATGARRRDSAAVEAPRCLAARTACVRDCVIVVLGGDGVTCCVLVTVADSTGNR